MECAFFPDLQYRHRFFSKVEQLAEFFLKETNIYCCRRQDVNQHVKVTQFELTSSIGGFTEV